MAESSSVVPAVETLVQVEGTRQTRAARYVQKRIVSVHHVDAPVGKGFA